MKQLLIALVVSVTAFADTHTNNIQSRLQWMHNSGYCGEVSLISAGLYYGQYVSQFDVRALVTQDDTQTSNELLIGINDTQTADKLHLQYEEWNTDAEENTDQFLSWIKQKVVQGYPVAIGVYANQYLFYKDTTPTDGDADYDHIVTVSDITSSHPLTDPTYYGNDQIGFSDHGLWDNDNTPVYYFSYAFDPFQKDRIDANATHGPIYSLANDGSNYGIAITGVKGNCLPVRVDPNFNYESPPINSDGQHPNTRPASMPLTLTITVSNLVPNTSYVLYRYNNLSAVPDSDFNANAGKAHEKWNIEISSGSTYTQTEMIQSNETAVYRCVEASAP